MLLPILVGCTTMVHVQATHPAAEVGIVKSTSMPSYDALPANISGVGEASGRVHYSVFDTYWAWARVQGEDPAITRMPTTIAGGPLVTCVVGLVVWPLLPGCFFLTKPSSRLLVLHVDEPTDQLPVHSDDGITSTQPQQATLSGATSDPEAIDLLFKMTQLKTLHDQGLITDEEYEATRQRILDSM